MQLAEAYRELSPLQDTRGWTVLETVESTQALVSAGTYSAVVAARQSQGRGRFGREFYSPPGGLWVSWQDQFESLEGLTLCLALSVCRFLEQHSLRPWIRWPNDVLVGPRKIAGCLIDGKIRAGASGPPVLTIGLGLNLKCDLSHFPPSMSGVVTTLLGEAPQPEKIAAMQLHRLVDQYFDCWSSVSQQVRRDGFASLCGEYQPYLFAGQHPLLQIDCENGSIQEKFERLRPDGSLQLQNGQVIYTCQRLQVASSLADRPASSPGSPTNFH